jgi:hypothetical protein
MGSEKRDAGIRLATYLRIIKQFTNEEWVFLIVFMRYYFKFYYENITISKSFI